MRKKEHGEGIQKGVADIKKQADKKDNPPDYKAQAKELNEKQASKEPTLDEQVDEEMDNLMNKPEGEGADLMRGETLDADRKKRKAEAKPKPAAPVEDIPPPPAGSLGKDAIPEHDEM